MAVDLAGPRDLPRRHRVQPAGRRAADRAQPAGPDVMPRTSIHQLCLPLTTFEEDVIAAEVGYDGLGIDTRKLDVGREAEQAALLRAAGLGAGVCCNRVWSILPTTNFPDPADPSERVADICAGIERLAPFAPDAVFVVLGASWPGGLDAAWPAVATGCAGSTRRPAGAGSR